MQWANLFNEHNVVSFLLLFFRFAALFIATPIFSHKNIPMNIKSAMAFVFTIVFYSAAPPLQISIDLPTIAIAILSEFMFGIIVGLIIQISYNVITFAGGIISFQMGFSMASAIDPQSGISMPIISQFLSLLGLMILFALDLHHWLILFVEASLHKIPLGGFVMSQNIFDYTIKATTNMFLVGLTISFPIIALAWLSDVIFGMLMKTMPQFNILVIGFPIKIFLSFGVLIAILTAVMLILKGEVQHAFNSLEILF